MMEDLRETTLATRDIYRGKVVHVQECDVRLPNGNQSIREVVLHPGAVAILAEPSPGSLLLVEQFRFATGEVLLELPAGKLEPNENPADCASRELEEETGYSAARVTKVYEFYTSPGFANERITLFHAVNLSSGSINLDEDEFVHVQVFAKEELEQLLQSGEIRDAKTILGIEWWLLRRAERL